MALTKMNTDLNIIAALDDEPNSVGGLSATELKAKFDESGNAIKTYINETLTAELEADAAAETLGALDKDGAASTVQGELDKVSNLGGVTASPAEINVLDGITASTAELNIMHGVAATAQDINDAVADKHSHANKSALDTLPSGGVVTALGGDNTTVPTSKAVSDALGASGNLPAGGTTGQSLVKASGTNYDTEWKSLAKADITDFPLSMNPTAHKSTHSVGGADALIDADIGLTPAVATALGLTGNPQVKDALGKLKTFIDTAQTTANGRAQIATGSYTGTGAFGASNPNSLTFDFAPKILWIFASGRISDNSFMSTNMSSSYAPIADISRLSTSFLKYGAPYNSDDTQSYSRKSADGKTITWYNEASANAQYNRDIFRYYYVAIG